MTQIPSLLHILTDAWNRAKAAEKKVNEERIAIEAEILALEDVEKKESGTVLLETGLDISFGLSYSLDQDATMEVYRNWPKDIPFPLKKQFSIDKKALDFCREHYPAEVRKLDACVVAKPKKPSFSFKSE
jgi:hypothetical protein